MANIMREPVSAPQDGLEILYDDDCLLAVNKPAGLVVHPTYKNALGTLLDALRARHPAAHFFLVGRLDRLTSGVVIAAKRRDAYIAMQRAWPDADKDYLAVVKGHVEPDRGEIDLPLGTDPTDRRRRVVREDGTPSFTRFERLSYSEAADVSLLCCRPVTGRRHQIRVHLAARGWPIVGDPVYGGADSLAFPRQALHAWRLSLTHPHSGRRLRIEAPIPDDLVGLLAAGGLALTSHLQL
jgi:23S rRNA pseudouridine1911/1915/1917 synthase